MNSLLIVSNNVLSRTKSNGKTIFSFVDGISGLHISQLYFSAELPEINKYSYFRITDGDVIKGRFNSNKRGKIIKPVNNVSFSENIYKKKFKKNSLTQMLRDLLWWRAWKSKKLLNWIEKNNPNSLFFCAGDSVFAYWVVRYLVKKYSIRLTVFITDDYIIARKKEGFLSRIRRTQIKRNLKKTLALSSAFYTVSEKMRDTYCKILGYESQLALNIPVKKKATSAQKEEKCFVFVYTGSLYYGRDRILSKIGLAIKEYNNKKSKEQRAILKIYSNNEIDEITKKSLNIEDGSIFAGRLDYQALQTRLQTADVLVFVESFDDAYIDKTKYSVSTKIPEYLQQEKPILAIGPESNGSMMLVKGNAYCIYDQNDIKDGVMELIENQKIRGSLSKKCSQYYKKRFNRRLFQDEFIKNVIGEKND